MHVDWTHTRHVSRRGIAFAAAAGLLTTISALSMAAAALSPRGLLTVSSPNRGTEGSVVNSVACTSPTTCVAVGDWINASFDKTLIEMQGPSGRWRIVPSPNPSINDNNLTSVACPVPKLCVVVGFNDGTTAQQNLVEIWRGHGWAIVPTPDVGTEPNNLDGVACPTVKLCFAVGRYETPTEHTLIELWQGSGWRVIASPNPGVGSDNFFNSVSCAGPKMCFAVGSGGVGLSEAFTVAWNGHSWFVVPNPGATGTDSGLTSVSCTSTSFCMASGYTYVGTQEHPLIEQWNGRKWTLMASPVIGSAGNAFESMACYRSMLCESADDVQMSAGSSNYQSYVERWTGHGWTKVKTPHPGASGSSLYGAVCTSATSCTEVGAFTPTTVDHTWIVVGR